MIAKGRVPQLDLNLERQVQETLLKLADEMLINSAHDCSEGGLAIAIAESCFSSLNRDGIGATIEVASNGLSAASSLFSESPSRIVITCTPDDLEKVAFAVGDVPFAVIGTVGDDVLRISVDGTEQISGTVIELETIWESALALKLIS
jgi:phosphoribosylformylglycinamidine synthase subunit PurL